jgi:hypothetical protein
MYLMRVNKARRQPGSRKATLHCELSHRDAMRTTNDLNSPREATQHA